MGKKEIIRYYSTNLNGTESIVIYDDEIVFSSNDLKITDSFETDASKEKIITIKDKFFVDAIILGNVYMPLKNEMITIYNKIKSAEIRKLHRPKNTSQKNISINDNDFIANIDMYIEETGDVFEKFIKMVKNTIITEISK